MEVGAEIIGKSERKEKKMGLLWWRGVVDRAEQNPVGLQALLLPLLAEILVNYY